jgi:hypothetical protein
MAVLDIYVQYHTGDYAQYLSKLSLPQLLKTGLAAWWSLLTPLTLYSTTLGFFLLQ